MPIKIESRAQAYDIRKVREALREATTAAYGKTVADIVLENFGGALIVHTDATVEPLRSVIGEALRILDAKTTPTDYLHQRSRAVTVLADSPNFVHASLAARIGDAIVMLQNDADRYEVIATLRGVTDPEQTSIK